MSKKITTFMGIILLALFVVACEGNSEEAVEKKAEQTFESTQADANHSDSK